MPELSDVGCEDALQFSQMVHELGCPAEEEQPVGIDHYPSAFWQFVDELVEEDFHVFFSAQARAHNPAADLGIQGRYL